MTLQEIRDRLVEVNKSIKSCPCGEGEVSNVCQRCVAAREERTRLHEQEEDEVLRKQKHPGPMLVDEWTQTRWLKENWIKQYGGTQHRNTAAIVRDLEALGQYPSPDQVDAVFKRHNSPNSVQRKFTCDSCGLEHNKVVQVGEESDYESATYKLCMACLMQAFQVLEEGS